MADLLDRFAPNIRALIQVASAAAVILLVAACGDPEKAQRAADESACMKSSIDREKSTKATLLKQRIEARDANQSTISIVIAQRRAVEEFCLEQAKCFKHQSEKAQSNLFEWCVDEADE